MIHHHFRFNKNVPNHTQVAGRERIGVSEKWGDEKLSFAVINQ